MTNSIKINQKIQPLFFLSFSAFNAASFAGRSSSSFNRRKRSRSVKNRFLVKPYTIPNVNKVHRVLYKKYIYTFYKRDDFF